MLSPDLYYADVHAIDLDALAASGVDTLLMDLDNTLLPRDSNVVPEDLKEWTREIKRRGFKACLVSNNWHERVRAVAEELEIDLVAKAIKPLPFAFAKALGKLGSKRSSAAVIGDQVFTDILGGNLMGMKSVLVTPLSGTDLPHTLFLRRIERMVLAGRSPLP